MGLLRAFARNVQDSFKTRRLYHEQSKRNRGRDGYVDQGVSKVFHRRSGDKLRGRSGEDPGKVAPILAPASLP